MFKITLAVLAYQVLIAASIYKLAALCVDYRGTLLSWPMRVLSLALMLAACAFWIVWTLLYVVMPWLIIIQLVNVLGSAMVGLSVIFGSVSTEEVKAELANNAS